MKKERKQTRKTVSKLRIVTEKINRIYRSQVNGTTGLMYQVTNYMIQLI